MSEPKSTGWTPKGVAFCWLPKAGLHRIRNRLESVAGVSSGLAVYLAFGEIASDKRSRVFTATHAYIAMRSGLSVRTVQQRINDLAEIELLRFTVPKLKAPAEYELLFVSDEQPLPSDAKQLHYDEQPLPSVRQPPETIIIADKLIIGKESPKNPHKTYSTKAKQLSESQKELADRIEAALGNQQWCDNKGNGDAGKWINRIKSEQRKAARVIAELESAIKEERIKTTPAQYAEQMWKEFK